MGCLDVSVCWWGRRWIMVVLFCFCIFVIRCCSRLIYRCVMCEDDGERLGVILKFWTGARDDLATRRMSVWVRDWWREYFIDNSISVFIGWSKSVMCVCVFLLMCWRRLISSGWRRWRSASGWIWRRCRILMWIWNVSSGWWKMVWNWWSRISVCWRVWSCFIFWSGRRLSWRRWTFRRRRSKRSVSRRRIIWLLFNFLVEFGCLV